jgi:hypothetical protein
MGLRMDDNLARFLRDELGVAGPADPQSWTVTAPLWVWRGNGTGPPPKAAWYFLTIGGTPASAIAAAAGVRGGFGSIPVLAQIGATIWTTSLFPSKSLKGLLLPVKAAVRRSERLLADSTVTVSITIN